MIAIDDGSQDDDIGWITDAARQGLDYTQIHPDHEIPRPPGHIAQIGDIIVLTDDDTRDTTKDNDKKTIANIRADAHHHYAAEWDGPLHLTPEVPGVVPAEGIKFVDYFVNDERAKNSYPVYMASPREPYATGHWRPQRSLFETVNSKNVIAVDEDKSCVGEFPLHTSVTNEGGA